jgi:CHASE2 domain-containing sensor protein
MNPDASATGWRRAIAQLRHVLSHHKYSLLWGGVLILGMQFLDYHELFTGVEGFILDLWVSSSASAPQTVAPIVIVEIDDDAYRDCFGGRSPMGPRLIETVVSNLAGSSDFSGPDVLGIDILTDAPGENYDSLRELSKERNPKTKIVWAAPAAHFNFAIPGFWDWLWSAEDDLVVEAAPVLGKDPGELNAPGEIPARVPSGNDETPRSTEARNEGEGPIYWAMPVYVEDQDLRVRRFRRDIFIANPKINGVRPTWPRTLAELRRSQEVRAEASGNPAPPGQFAENVEDVVVSYNVAFQHNYHLKELFTCSGARSGAAIMPNAEALAAYRNAVTMSGHPVVLLGGTFEYGRDVHRTSTGSVPGLMINAYALAAEMAETRGIGIREAPRGYLVLLDVLVMFGILWAFSRAKTIRGKMRLSLIPLLTTIVLSRAAFSFGYLWVSCIGVAFGFLLHLPLEIYLDAGHAGGHAKEPDQHGTAP